MRIIGFPGRYVQGPGALDALGALAAELGASRPVVVSDDAVEAAVGATVTDSLARAGLVARRLRFEGECTREAIDALAAQARDAAADLVIALGGGKALDTGKGIARALGLRLAVAPTVASNDAPTSRLIVRYDASHRLVGVDYLARNPDLVLVDTEAIVRAPVRFFRAGLGDALSKRYEAAQCARAGGTNFFGGTPPDTAGVLAERCHRAIVELGEAALADVARHRTTPAVESVVEATVLLSGLGFESGGLSVSHALLRGLSAVPALGGALHGEQVAYGTVVQLLLEGRDAAEIDAHRGLLARLGLPATLAALGLPAPADAQLDEIAALTMAAPYIGHFQRPLDASAIAGAMRRAEAMGPAAGPPPARDDRRGNTP
jgi:glycerol dehydrogenase